jgi:hypothetical protein
MVGDPLELDEAADFEASDTIGARPERRLEG